MLVLPGVCAMPAALFCLRLFLALKVESPNTNFLSPLLTSKQENLGKVSRIQGCHLRATPSLNPEAYMAMCLCMAVKNPRTFAAVGWESWSKLVGLETWCFLLCSGS